MSLLAVWGLLEARNRILLTLLLPLARDVIAGLVTIGELGVAALGWTLDCWGHAPGANDPDSLGLTNGLLELVGNFDQRD